MWPFDVAPVLMSIPGEELLVSANGFGGLEPDDTVNYCEATVLF